jgi:hypothetical protein
MHRAGDPAKRDASLAAIPVLLLEGDVGIHRTPEGKIAVVGPVTARTQLVGRLDNALAGITRLGSVSHENTSFLGRT